MNGDAINPCRPNFDLKINDKLGAIPVSITKILDRKYKGDIDSIEYFDNYGVNV